METGDTADRDMENPQIAGGRYVTSLGRSGVPLTKPSAASAILGATVSMSTVTRGRWGAGYKKKTRSTTRIWAEITT